MNFQSLQPLPRSKQLLDLAFRRAREKAKQPTAKDWLERIKRKESSKLDIIKDYLAGEFSKILEAWPKQEELSAFYLKLMHVTLDYRLYKKSFGALSWAVRRIKTLHREYVSKINKARGKQKISEVSQQFYGRVSSIVKQMDSSLKYLNESRTILRTYPDIKEMFTVCIYGFPNVGKTTLLNKLTKATAKVADYAFTTQSINAGSMSIQGRKVQVLDVPGTLAREDKMNSLELQAELVLEEVADLVIYVLDPSGYSDVSLEKQEKLLQKVRRKKPVLVYLSKVDLCVPALVKSLPYQPYSVEMLNEEIARRLP